MGKIKYTPADSTINKLNGQMRAEPWYQEWFAQRGLDPNRAKLDNRQQAELEQTMAQNGFQLPAGIHVDPAGNWNTKHGYAGLPAVTKAAIITLAGLGTAGAAGAFGGAGGGGVGAGGTGTGLNAAATSAAAHPAGGGLLMGSGAFPTTAQLSAGLPTLGSTAIGTGMGSTPSIAGGSVLGGGAGGGATQLAGQAAKKVGGSVLDRLMGGDGQDIADIASMMGALGNSEAGNRINNAGLTMQHGALALGAQRDRREQEQDALKKLNQTSYIKSGGAPFDASQVKLANGRELPSFNFPRAPISDAMKQGAADLETQLLERMKSGGSYAPPPASEFTNRGTMEKIGNYGSMGASALGMADRFGLKDDIGRGAKKVFDWIF